MAAPTKLANVKKVLANSEPSTHGTKRTFVSWTEPQKRANYAVKALKVMIVRVSLTPAMQCTFSLTKCPMSVPAST